MLVIKKKNLLQRDLAVVTDSLPEVKLGPQTRAVTIVYVVAIETIYTVVSVIVIAVAIVKVLILVLVMVSVFFVSPPKQFKLHIWIRIKCGKLTEAAFITKLNSIAALIV